jgi:fido (protein-threonine AMPylation protein)
MYTETALREWRYGTTQAERLCAAILHIEGYSNVDPQHPLGGPDGVKDVLCRRGITSFVAGVFFPTTTPSESEILSKFKGDLEGVPRNGARGFAFFVNQSLSIAKRAELAEAGRSKAEVVEIYHLERLRSLLDSPRGCGARLEYLRIPMTPEEQFAYWNSSSSETNLRLERVERILESTLPVIKYSLDLMINRTTAQSLDLKSQLSSVFQGQDSTNRDLSRIAGFPTFRLDTDLLCWLHRIAIDWGELPKSLQGGLRTINVWVGSTNENTGNFTPPAPSEIPQLISDWAAGWRDGYESVLAGSSEDKLDALVRFYYGFLAIHPFPDGNGRLARLLLAQAARELMNRDISGEFDVNRIDHQRALLAANHGDMSALRKRIAAALL